MHPDIMGELIRQRTTELQEEARKTGLARALRRTLRQRSRTAGQDTFAVPAIPDYVDGMFRTTENAGSHAPAGRGAR
jgi:hypothetical protein